MLLAPSELRRLVPGRRGAPRGGHYLGFSGDDLAESATYGSERGGARF